MYFGGISFGVSLFQKKSISCVLDIIKMYSNHSLLYLSSDV